MEREKKSYIEAKKGKFGEELRDMTVYLQPATKVILQQFKDRLEENGRLVEVYADTH